MKVSKTMAKHKHVSMAEVESCHCRWPIGDPIDRDNFRFCGREVVPTTSWCIKHLYVVTPHAHRTIKRELDKWEARCRGEEKPVIMAAKMTDTEAMSSDKDREEELV